MDTVQFIQSKFEALKRHVVHTKASDANTRKEKLRQIVSYLKTHEQAFQDALLQDMKRLPIDTTSELLMVKTEADFAIKHLSKWMKPHMVANSNMSRGTKSYFKYEPKGTCLILGPWNAPFACILVPMIGALAAGNTVFLKPSEMAPASAKVLVKMIQALFKEEEVVCIEGDKTVAQLLLTLPFNHIYYTGNSTVGKYVMEKASAHLTSVTLELGGKNPAFIDKNTDIKSTAAKIGWGKCANAGQACVAPDYVLIDKSIQPDFIQSIQESLTKMYNPDARGFEKCTSLPRIINQHHTIRLKTYLDDALSKGAKIEIGGTIDVETNYVAPTVLSNVTRDMLIMQEEVFGPILPVMGYDNLEAAIAYVNENPDPLALYIFSMDRKYIDTVLNSTTAGSTVVNHNMIQAGLNSNLPFGGVNNSGMGKSIGKSTFASFSNQRSVVEQPTGWRDFSNIAFPPYSNLYTKMIQYLFKN